MAAAPTTTGDTHGAAEALRSLLRSLKCPPERLPSLARLEAGDPAALLPALHHCLLSFSRHVAALAADYHLAAKSDARFVEAGLRFCWEALGVRAGLTPAQFLSEGFAERKLLLLQQIARACRDHHNAVARKERLAGLRAANAQQRLYGGAAGEAAAANASEDSPRKQAGSRHVAGKPRPAALPAYVKVVSAAQQRAQAIAAAAAERPAAEAPAAEEPAAPPDLDISDECAPRPASPRGIGKQSGGSGCDPRQAAPSPADQPRLLPTAIAAYLPTGQPQQRLPTARPASPVLGLPVTAGHVQAVCAAQATGPLPLHEAPPPAAYQSPLRKQQAPAPPATASASAAAHCSTAAAHCSTAAAHCSTLARVPDNSDAQQLIEELQLRLQLAEEAAATAREESQRMQERMQARLAVLEGRVRFLEAGLDLRPATEPLLLSWRSPPKQPVPPQSSATAHALATSSQQRLQGKNTAAAPEQQLRPPQQQQRPLHQQQQQHKHVVRPAEWHSSVWSHSLHEQSHGGTYGGGLGDTASGRGSLCQPGPPVKAGGCVGAASVGAASVPTSAQAAPAAWQPCSGGGASGQANCGGGVTQLLTSLQGRMSEADELLHSLQRR